MIIRNIASGCFIKFRDKPGINIRFAIKLAAWLQYFASRIFGSWQNNVITISYRVSLTQRCIDANRYEICCAFVALGSREILRKGKIVDDEQCPTTSARKLNCFTRKIVLQLAALLTLKVILQRSAGLNYCHRKEKRKKRSIYYSSPFCWNFFFRNAYFADE